nr:immunoglobulin heavy chain junction region [Macaca mulatta]MOX91669.1 immunoglobulin heavy chain junction region [Macaca mulatta]MOX91844.1 immunoglobulin heavy chain junction region [Macaca mulatta]MOX91884.1 immunoglobulin heavy chain junction region [Macaca mulatta]MOX92074.1 immunoglobulin heavy chain junction region [Macaca mulatta]
CVRDGYGSGFDSW